MPCAAAPNMEYRLILYPWIRSPYRSPPPDDERVFLDAPYLQAQEVPFLLVVCPDNEGEEGTDEQVIDEAGEGVGGSRHEREETVSYDTTLPTLHQVGSVPSVWSCCINSAAQYLGTDLEELSGRTVLDDGSCQTLPLLALPKVVLVPGQTLPLQLFRPALISMMRHVIQHDRTFGLVNSRVGYCLKLLMCAPEVGYCLKLLMCAPEVEDSSTSSLASVGTTAEVRSYREEHNESFGFSMLRVKAEGRQRFEILETRQQADGMIVAKVRILPEVSLGDAGAGIRLASLDRYRIVGPSTAPAAVCLRRKQVYPMWDGIHWKARRFNFAHYTFWPPWVYQQYDPEELMARIQEELQGWHRRSPDQSTSPTDFSFWVAANLPLDDTMRLNLLAFNCATQRLRCELSILRKYTLLCCQECQLHIANRSDVFAMSREGPQGTYVNPNGYVHETLTVYKARGLVLVGRASTEHSWFPGYAWTIVQCQQCSNHLGWMFHTATEKLKPQTFWGLCRSAMLPGVDGDVERWRPLL
ncbi:CRBN [Cordylochernes scorpioides]|uniref:Protein cereblon n=1 Tax=Cordylochernes scorpioides TaxID=51811 RepID=A0ABY6KG30_9ARAC|nr:CRBN [Cordylochernes scorpioides]